MTGLKREVVANLAQHGVGAEVGRRVGRNNGRDIAGMSRELVIAARAEVSVIENLAAAGIRFDERAGNRLHGEVAANRKNFNVAVADIGERDGPRMVSDVYVRVTHIVDVDNSVGSFKAQISMESFRRKRARGRTKAKGCVLRDEKFVVDSTGLLIGAREKMRNDLDTIAALLIIDFRFVRLKRGLY